MTNIDPKSALERSFICKTKDATLVLKVKDLKTTLNDEYYGCEDLVKIKEGFFVLCSQKSELEANIKEIESNASRTLPHLMVQKSTMKDVQYYFEWKNYEWPETIPLAEMPASDGASQVVPLETESGDGHEDILRQLQEPPSPQQSQQNESPATSFERTDDSEKKHSQPSSFNSSFDQKASSDSDTKQLNKLNFAAPPQQSIALTDSQSVLEHEFRHSRQAPGAQQQPEAQPLADVQPLFGSSYQSYKPEFDASGPDLTYKLDSSATTAQASLVPEITNTRYSQCYHYDESQYLLPSKEAVILKHPVGYNKSAAFAPNVPSIPMQALPPARTQASGGASYVDTLHATESQRSTTEKLGYDTIGDGMQPKTWNYRHQEPSKYLFEQTSAQQPKQVKPLQIGSSSAREALQGVQYRYQNSFGAPAVASKSDVAMSTTGPELSQIPINEGSQSPQFTLSGQQSRMYSNYGYSYNTPTAATPNKPLPATPHALYQFPPTGRTQAGNFVGATSVLQTPSVDEQSSNNSTDKRDYDILVEGVPSKLWNDEDEESLKSLLEDWQPSGQEEESSVDSDTVSDIARVGNDARCKLHTSSLKYEALIGRSAIVFKAYGNTNIKVRPLVDKTRVLSDSPMLDQGQDPNLTSAYDETGERVQRAVKVTGFGDMTAAEITSSESRIIDRLERKQYKGGPVDHVDVKKPRLAGLKPFVVVTFKNPNDATSIVEFAKTKGIPFIKGLSLQVELYSPPPKPPVPEATGLDFVISKVPLRNLVSDEKLAEALEQAAFIDSDTGHYKQIFRSASGDCVVVRFDTKKTSV